MSWLPSSVRASLPDADRPERQATATAFVGRQTNTQAETAAITGGRDIVEPAPFYGPTNEAADAMAWAAALGYGQQDETDYGDKTQNFGVSGATKGVGLGTLWISQVPTSREPALSGNLDMGRPVADQLTPYMRNTGFNALDENGLPTISTGLNDPAVGMSTGQDAYLFYQESSQERRKYLQILLYEAGLVDRENPVPNGGWGSILDGDYMTAWEQAVVASQQSNIPLFVLLEQEAEAIRARGGIDEVLGRDRGAQGPKRPTAQVISDEDALSIVDDVAKEQLGRKLTPDEKNVAMAITKAIQQRMTNEQEALIDQQMEGGGVATQPTNPRTTATEQVESRYGDEAYVYDLAQAFANLIGISSGGG